MPTSPQQQGKAKHYGFAQVPRLVLRGTKYKNLSLIEKGLYACLKDICGDDGECFYTLRNLAKEIGTSISTLSRYIPKLRDYELILAEKKPGTQNGHEIWHIRIVNIWTENDALYHPQDCFNMKQSSVSQEDKEGTFVPHQDSTVSLGNKDGKRQAKDCFYLNARIRHTSNEEESFNERESVPPHSAHAIHILDYCEHLLGIQIPKTPYIWQKAEILASEDVNASDEALKLVIEKMKNDKYWKNRGLAFENIAANFSREWVLIQQQRQKPGASTSTQRSDVLISDDANRRNIERLKAATKQ